MPLLINFHRHLRYKYVCILLRTAIINLFPMDTYKTMNAHCIPTYNKGRLVKSLHILCLFLILYTLRTLFVGTEFSKIGKLSHFC